MKTHTKAPHPYRPLLLCWSSDHKNHHISKKKHSNHNKLTHQPFLWLSSLSRTLDCLLPPDQNRKSISDWCRKLFCKCITLQCYTDKAKSPYLHCKCISSFFFFFYVQSNKSLECTTNIFMCRSNALKQHRPVRFLSLLKWDTVRGHSVHLQALCRS